MDQKTGSARQSASILRFTEELLQEDGLIVLPTCPVGYPPGRSKVGSVSSAAELEQGMLVFWG